MKRSSTVDYIKGILIVLVTIGHAVQFAVYKSSGFWDDPLFKAIYMFHMPLFMGISGYLAHAGIQRTPFIAFTAAKTKAYVIPILAWAVTYKFGLFLILKAETLAALPNRIFQEFIGSLWFLWALLGCLLLTSAIKTLSTRWFWFFYAASFPLVLMLPERGHFIMLKYMFPYFQFGFAVASMKRTEPSDTSLNIILFIAIAIATSCFLLWTHDSYIYNSKMALTSENIANVLVRYIAGFATSAAIVLVIIRLHSISPQRLNNVVETLGRDSIYIYIIQSYAFIAIARVALTQQPSAPNGLPGSLIAIIIGIAVAVACWGIGKALTKSDIIAAVFFGRSKKTS